VVEEQTKQDRVSSAYIGQENHGVQEGKVGPGIAKFRQNQNPSTQWMV